MPFLPFPVSSELTTVQWVWAMAISHTSSERPGRVLTRRFSPAVLLWNTLQQRVATRRCQVCEVLVICSVCSECFSSQIKTPVLRLNMKTHISLNSFYLRIFNPKGKYLILKDYVILRKTKAYCCLWTMLNFITGCGPKIFLYFIYMTLTIQSIKNHCKFLMKRDLLDIRLNIMCGLCLDSAVNWLKFKLGKFKYGLNMRLY